MRLTRMCQWLLPLIMLLILLGECEVLGQEECSPGEPAPPETVAPAPVALEKPSPTQIPPPPPGIGPELKLKSFRLEGNETMSDKDLKKEMSIKLPSIWPPWGDPPVFRLQDLEYDIDRLKIYYRKQGFYHTRITPEIDYGPGGEVEVTLHIDEDPFIKVADINVEVTGPVDLSDLEDDWPLEVGDRFTEKGYDDLKNLYLNYLPNHGHPKVKVTGRVTLDEVKNTARISITVNPGPLCYFGPVNIKDLEKLETPEAAIREKITFKAGDLFELEELFKSQRKLYATDLFRSVVLAPETVPPQETSIPILVEIEEKKKRSVKVGLGYGDEELVRARLGLRYRNLWGGGRLLDLDARYSALGYMFSELFTNPVVFGSRFDFVNQSGARRRELPGFTDQAYFTQSRLETDIPWDFRLYFGHGLEFARPFDIPVSTLIRLQEAEPEKMYRASYALLGLRQDTVDDHANPHYGGILDWGNQYAPTFLGSGLQFTQSVLDLRRYHAIAKSDFVLAGRVRFGIIQPMQSTREIPISRRFFAGGANSVRGYSLDTLGPRNAANDPIGGEAVLELGIEGRFPLPVYKNLGGVIFLDAGNVFPKVHNIDPGHLKYSPGFGLRYLSPIGAIGVDIAFPTNRINYQEDPPYQFHFTVGYGF
jgi:outer membrane protein assembly complex protein YaeT